MKFIKTTLVGIGQIFLQENWLSGLLITIAMFFSHWTLGVSCFLGALIGTLTAQVLKFPEQEIKQGLYGFNASLALMCTLFTFGLTDHRPPIIWLLGAVASVVATLIMRVFLKKQKIAFTFPFVVTCWIFCWGVAQLHLFGLSQTTPTLPDYTDAIHGLAEPFYAWAEINFGSSLITGVLIMLAIAINQPIAAVYGMAVAPISALLAHALFDVHPNVLNNGLYSFSAILVACVFAGTRRRDFAYTLIGVLLAVCIHHYVSHTGLASYTIGFIMASWCVIWLKNRVDNQIDALLKQPIDRRLINMKTKQ